MASSVDNISVSRAVSFCDNSDSAGGIATSPSGVVVDGSNGVAGADKKSRVQATWAERAQWRYRRASARRMAWTAVDRAVGGRAAARVDVWAVDMAVNLAVVGMVAATATMARTRRTAPLAGRQQSGMAWRRQAASAAKWHGVMALEANGENRKLEEK
jgi:hypothetical protein